MNYYRNLLYNKTVAFQNQAHTRGCRVCHLSKFTFSEKKGKYVAPKDSLVCFLYAKVTIFPTKGSLFGKSCLPSLPFPPRQKQKTKQNKTNKK